jgi:hypothetical protein
MVERFYLIRKKIKWERNNPIKIKWKKFEVQSLVSKILKNKIKKIYNPKKLKKTWPESAWVGMQNLQPCCDIGLIPLKTNWIKLWSLITKQPNVKMHDNLCHFQN